MQKGEVIFCPHYIFPDGEEGKKLVVNLNNPSQGEPYLLLLTTSKRKSKIESAGCYSHKGYYVIPAGSDLFTTDYTWILFWTLHEFSLEEELRESWNSNFQTVGILKPQTINAIISCIKNSSYINAKQIAYLK